MNKYQQQKARAQQLAREWQQDETPKSWGQVAEESATLEKLGKRYGLIKEFRENGII